MSAEAPSNPTRVVVRPDHTLSVQRQRFRIQVETAAGAGVTSAEERLVVGSSREADLVVDDAAVSRLHFEIVADPGGYLLRDLGSTNGTRVDGLRVIEAFLPARARITAGETQLAFTLLDDAEAVPLHPGARFGALHGESPVMRALFERLSRIAARDSTALLEGESGTGKELAARAIHEASARREQPFVVVDCTAIARTLLEAELFGHQRGAYTGATQAREGAFQRAGAGTLFLDEIGELDLELQPRLLGALERREVKPMGAANPIPVQARIVAATNRDLLREVNRGTFREDLYHRVAVVRARLPPLRERPGDIPLLVRHFLDDHSRRDGTRYSLDDATVQRLRERPWRGNVRELRNVIEQIVAFGIEEAEPPPADAPPVASTAEPGSGAPAQSFRDGKAAVVDAFEREYLTAILRQHGGNITAAARAADLDRVHFLRILDKHGLRKPRTP